MTAKRSRKPANHAQTVAIPQTTALAQSLEPSFPMQRDVPVILSSKAILWQPRHMAASSTLIHLPVLFWLMETARPSSVVQLGLQEGVGFMALCQAIDKLGLEAGCMGLGVPSGAGAAFSEDLTENHSALYGDFSFILNEDSGRAARHIRSGQIDMLVIDTPADDAFLSSLQSHWLPLLSDCAVLVLHAPERNFVTTEARKVYDALLRAHPSISFPHAATGLDIILVGKEQPDRLTHLAELDLSAPEYLSTRSIFVRLGQGLEDSCALSSKTRAFEKAEMAQKELEARIVDMKAACDQLQGQINAAHAAEDAQATQTGTLQARIFDLSQRVEAQDARIAERDVLLKEKQAALTDLAACAEELRAENARLLKTQDELCAELARAKDAAETLQALHADSISQIAGRDAALAEKAQEAEAAEQVRREMEAAILRQQEELRIFTERAMALSKAEAVPVAETRKTPKAAKPSKTPRKTTSAKTKAPAGSPPSSDETTKTVASRLMSLKNDLLGKRPIPSLRQQATALRQDPLFDSEWYAATYPDSGGADKAVEHYLREGAFVGNDPSPAFSTIGYYQRNPDVADSDWAALAHYIYHGKAERRKFEPF